MVVFDDCVWELCWLSLMIAFEGYQIWSFFFSLSIFLFSSNALFGSKEGRDFNGGKGHLVWFEKGEEEKQSNYDYTHTVDK